MRRCPGDFTRCTFVSTRLRRWYPPERTTKVSGRAQGVVSRHGSGGDGFPGLRVLAGWDDGMGAASGDRVMALAGVVGAGGGHRTDLFAKCNLAEQTGQDKCVPGMAPVH